MVSQPLGQLRLITIFKYLIKQQHQNIQERGWSLGVTGCYSLGVTGCYSHCPCLKKVALQKSLHMCYSYRCCCYCTCATPATAATATAHVLLLLLLLLLLLHMCYCYCTSATPATAAATAATAHVLLPLLLLHMCYSCYSCYCDEPRTHAVVHGVWCVVRVPHTPPHHTTAQKP